VQFRPLWQWYRAALGLSLGMPEGIDVWPHILHRRGKGISAAERRAVIEPDTDRERRLAPLSAFAIPKRDGCLSTCARASSAL
jgi:hypothetical protein